MLNELIDNQIKIIAIKAINQDIRMINVENKTIYLSYKIYIS